MVRDSAGNLYGTTFYGGGGGVVFKLDTSGNETVLYSFCSLANCADGSGPEAGVIRDSEGSLYGTTAYGGAHGAGIVFKLDTSGKETVLYSFCSLPSCSDGHLPSGGVIRDSDGNLYGTTYAGGGDNRGVVFKLDGSGIETVFYSFCSPGDCADGYRPESGVIRDSEGNLYGTTYYGGANDDGVVYKVDASGNETVLYSFCSLFSCADGFEPIAGLIRDSDGNLYGTTVSGGPNSEGVVFKLDTSGTETVLYSFCTLAHCTDGSEPFAGVIRDSDGNLYGTTIGGGVSGGGVVFKLKP